MDKETRKKQNMRDQNIESKNSTVIRNPKKKEKDKSLPWWVELLFVQIGLPDRLLIKILKLNKKSKEFIKNDKKIIFTFFFLLIAFSYFYPIIKYSKNKLNCEANARKYFIETKNIKYLNNKTIKMLSTNFCNEGAEINEFQRIKK